jgi:hypothetical protein
LCCLGEPYWYESWFTVLEDKYKLFIFEKIRLSLDKLVVILLLEILDNLWILLKALASLEIEFPTVEKSIKFWDELVSLGDKITYAGEFTCAVLFFFW